MPSKEIFYSDKYNDDSHEYRHVILPKVTIVMFQGPIYDPVLSPGPDQAGAQTQADDGVRVESPGGDHEPRLDPLHDPRARAKHSPVQESSQSASLTSLQGLQNIVFLT